MNLHCVVTKLAGLCHVQHNTVAIAVFTMGSTMMHTVFMFYYVKVFLTQYHVSEAWFQFSQVVFMIWNAINDPLFGYLQDTGDSWMRKRKTCIRVACPFFVLSFLVPWFALWNPDEAPPWAVGVHLVTALFLYDGFFSFIMVAYCGLFTELTSVHSERVRFLKYNQSFQLVGLSVLFFVDRLSASLSQFSRFQLCCVVIALLAYCCINYTASYAPDCVAQVTAAKSEENNGNSNQSEEAQKYNEAPTTFPQNNGGSSSTLWNERWRLSREVVLEKNFQCLVASNFFHVCRSTAQLNFAAIMIESLVPREVLGVGTTRLSLFYGISSVLPQIVFIVGSPVVNKIGPYNVLRCSCGLSIVNGCLMLMFGRQASYMILLFMICDCIAVHSISPLFNVMFPDFVDYDMWRHRRTQPISSLIFSLNALFTKPAQSLAPMVVIFILNQFGYEQYQKKRLTDPQESQSLFDAMFWTMCLCPIVLGLFEFIAIHRYTLRNKHLVIV